MQVKRKSKPPVLLSDQLGKPQHHRPQMTVMHLSLGHSVTSRWRGPRCVWDGLLGLWNKHQKGPHKRNDTQPEKCLIMSTFSSTVVSRTPCIRTEKSPWILKPISFVGLCHRGTKKWLKYQNLKACQRGRSGEPYTEGHWLLLGHERIPLKEEVWGQMSRGRGCLRGTSVETTFKGGLLREDISGRLSVGKTSEGRGRRGDLWGRTSGGGHLREGQLKEGCLSGGTSAERPLREEFWGRDIWRKISEGGHLKEGCLRGDIWRRTSSEWGSLGGGTFAGEHLRGDLPVSNQADSWRETWEPNQLLLLQWTPLLGGTDRNSKSKKQRHHPLPTPPHPHPPHLLQCPMALFGWSQKGAENIKALCRCPQAVMWAPQCGV